MLYLYLGISSSVQSSECTPVALFDEVVRSVEIQYPSHEFRRSEFRAILFHLFCTVQILVLNNAWERLWEVL